MRIASPIHFSFFETCLTLPPFYADREDTLSPARQHSRNASNAFQASQAAIKPRIKTVQVNIEDFTRSMNDNKKEVQLLRSELATFEHKANETTNDTLKEILEDIANLERDFRKMQQMDINEVSFLKQQVGQLNGEKTKIEQSVILLETRINSIEHEVGFE